ncbi:unnamed protein product [Vicia faba]|uniref:Sugar phosphate transporter domain-containing protein n=1 Tax=Vicia faba TaxID=3906 RepID=A0AAV1AAF6_VICFA|nr:unnamed protein product [Vicia faba]
MESEKKSSSISNFGAWGMNVVSSVGIIMANKQLMSNNGYAFTFATTLTGFHFAVTALVGIVSNATGYSASKHVPLWELIWFSAIANISITGMNLSLMLNSVGFYQISKLSMIPVVCVMEWILHAKHYSREVKAAVMVVVIGVGVCTVTDVKVNLKGFVCACLAVVSSSLQQISIGSLQKKYSIGSFELLNVFRCHYVHSSFMHPSCVLQYKPVPLHWALLSSFLPGFRPHENIVGMVIYSWAVELEKSSNVKTLPHAKNSLTEEEIRLLREGIENSPLKDVELGEAKV